MSTFTINFDGLCCHMDVGNDKKRMIAPDAHAHGHTPYIEFFADDFDPVDNSAWTSVVGYDRWTDAFDRIDFGAGEAYRVELIGASAGPLKVLPSYLERVPQLTFVSFDFGWVKRNYLDQNPAPDDIALLMDLPAGTLYAGPPESLITRFIPTPRWPDGRVAQWVSLDVDLDTSQGVFIQFTPLSGGTSRTLKLKSSTRLITFGNQLPDDIYGIPPLPDRPEHFHVYYGLAAQPPTSQPVPMRDLGLGTGCSNTNWP